MASNQQLSVANTLTNPGGTFEVTVHDDEFPVESYSSNEAALFENQFNDLVASFSGSILSSVFSKRQETIAKSAAFAKQQLGGKVFGGVNAADNEIGFDILRPGHIRAEPGTGDAVNDWYFSPTEAGWNDWIGDDAGNAYQFNENQVSVILAFVDQADSTEVSAMNVESFGRNMDMLPHDLNDARLQDNENELNVQSLPTLIGRENDSAHIKLRHDNATESQPRLLGVTFGLGKFLNTEDY